MCDEPTLTVETRERIADRIKVIELVIDGVLYGAREEHGREKYVGLCIAFEELKLVLRRELHVD